MTTMNILLKANESWFHHQIVEFAEKYGLNTWDWVALIITSFSLIIAIVSVVVATKTLISQKATQKNTQPIMNIEIQQFLIGQKLLSILDSYIFLFAFQYFLTKNSYKVKPSYHFWELIKLPLDDLDESLFYNENEKFVTFHHLRIVLNEFNSNILALKDVINKISAQKEEKELEIVHIYDSIGQIINAYYETLETCFNQNSNQIIEFLNKFFFSVFETRYYKMYKEKFCSFDDQLSLPFIENSESDAMQKSIYENFADSAFRRIRSIKAEEKTSFVENLSKHVDAIIINTPCNGFITPLKSLKENKKEYKLTINPDTSMKYESRKWEVDTPIDERILPKAYKGLTGWFFYVLPISGEKEVISTNE